MPVAPPKPGASLVRRAEQGKLVYRIDCSIPCRDQLMDESILEAFKAYLEEHLKINGKTGQLGDKVKVAVDGHSITITKFQVLFAKRALKFFTRKFLMKQKLRDYIRPVSTQKFEYQLRYYNIELGDDDSD